MAELPTGTVTFLFSDIEGSTRLLDELGTEHYAEALGHHRRVLRESFSRNGGIEVDTAGDAFFVAFTRASDAVAAAEAAQRSLGAGPICVRMGLHTGEPLVHEGNYVGMDVHRAARIMAAGHGGQTLLSETTARLADAAALRDLGEHRLKDLSAPQRLYQLGDGVFPPLKSLNQTNLPVQPTQLVGRERELAQAGALLRSHRLLTLTGPGGSGKTRLALQLAAEAAEDFPDGVFWVPLAPLRDPDLVLATIAQTVGARDGPAEHLRDRRALLLLDNLEHLLSCVPSLGQLVSDAPELRLLATSREPLRLAGECEYDVRPLAEGDAEVLFVERVRLFDAGFEQSDAVGEICRRLDGLPLAIELAAARIRLLSPERLLERLEQRLPLLTGGPRNVPERQQTLRATIEWSYDLLQLDEQRLFARLAIFRGGFSLEAAESVCEATLELLGSLFEKSLLRRRDDRFFMLETIRELAAERLRESGEEAGLAERHCEHYSSYVTSLVPAVEQIDAGAVAQLDLERDNIRSALELVSREKDSVRLAELAGRLWVYWWYRGLAAEGLAWLSRAHAAAAEMPPDLQVSVLAGLSNLSFRSGQIAAGRAWAESELDLARSADLANALPLALRDVGNAWLEANDLERAVDFYEQSAEAARAEGDRFGEEAATINIANVELARGHFQRAFELCNEMIPLSGTSDPVTAVVPVFNRAFALYGLGRFEEAEAGFLDALQVGIDLAFLEGIFYPLEALGCVAAGSGRSRRAARLLAAAERLREEGSVHREAMQQAATERALGEVRAALGSDAFAREWTLGLELDTDAAIAYALEPADS